MISHWMTVSLLLISILYIIPDGCFAQRKLGRNVAVAASEVKASVIFDCPEEFGYYPHPTDCTQYFVCVFGGALLESCTGGLMYSHELQTCDWPRNVGCDAGGVGGETAQSATAAPISSRGRAEQEQREVPIRSRYSITSAVPSPPPQPPQPAPIVTSRGQSRQLHHQQQQQQQLTKQQQQLYEDAEEQLPPAEEIETDRQQRVYRGQPSTLGQVQRDRDGLRHSNAIPSYNGRSEKIGVISFGTHQSQPQAIQQYRDVHDNNVETNLDMTARRRKRQIQRRVEESGAGSSQQPSLATATARTLYNGSQHYDPSHYDPYYALYDDDVELYRDVDYAQNYNNNQNSNQNQQSSYRGNPTSLPAPQPSEEPIPVQVSPKRGSQNSYVSSYSSQDVYQQPTVPDYNEDNSFNSQVDDQTNYRQTNRESQRIETNELSFSQGSVSISITTPSTTSKTTTASATTTAHPSSTTEPFTIPTRRSPVVTPTANQTRAQSLQSLTLLPNGPGHIHTLPIIVPDLREPSPKILLTVPKTVSSSNKPITLVVVTSTSTPRPTTTTATITTSSSNPLDQGRDASFTAPITYRPSKSLADFLAEYSLHVVPVIRPAVVNLPAPFTLPNKHVPLISNTTSTAATTTTTTHKSPINAYHYITKSITSTSTEPSVSRVTPSNDNAVAEKLIAKLIVEASTKRFNSYRRNTPTATPSTAIVPTTYAPPNFFLRSLLPTTSTTTIAPLSVPSHAFSHSSYYDRDKDQYTKQLLKANNKSMRKFVNPIAINNVFASSTEDVPLPASASTRYNDYSSVKPKAVTLILKKEPSSTTFRYIPSIPTTTSSSTMTPAAILSYPSSSVSAPSASVYVHTSPSDIINAFQTTDKYSHYFEPNLYIAPNSKTFRNTIEVPSAHQLLEHAIGDFAKAEPDQPPTYKPKAPFYPKTYVKTAVVADNTAIPYSRNNSLPGPAPPPLPPLPPRASRVNAAIKSMIIGFGGSRRQNAKCSDNNVKCNIELKQRTNTRGRGTTHYNVNSASAEPPLNVNRGTPAPRSRPTLKPSTSIVSKVSEFVDIYRFPPRRPEAIYPTPQPDKTAAKCRKDVCLLPDCNCGGKEIPGDLRVEQLPQIVLLTFDDSVNDLNKGLYSDLFEKGRVNPNGCPISATFYVSHEWTDYSQVQNLYSDGHELASHTVSHSFGEQFSQKKWTREVAGQREILSAYGGVKLEDVRGMRAPFLSVGGNKMFKMLYDSNLTYDSSMPIYENKPPSWPYTLDYKLFHDCMIPPCPTRSYPGVWEVPMVMWQDLNGGRCSMGDACSNPQESENVYKMIMKNFERHYTTNRAPFGLFYHAAWFTQPHHKEGFIQFLDTINQMKDVYLITNWQAIQWVRDPTPLNRLGSFQPFQCNYSDRPKRCNNPKVCNLWHKSGVRYMRTCQPCPDIYPWTGNSGIRSSRIDNDIED